MVHDTSSVGCGKLCTTALRQYTALLEVMSSAITHCSVADSAENMSAVILATSKVVAFDTCHRVLCRGTSACLLACLLVIRLIVSF